MMGNNWDLIAFASGWFLGPAVFFLAIFAWAGLKALWRVLEWASR